MLNQIRFLLAVVCVISKVFDKAWWESKGVSTQESKIKTSPYSGDLTVQVGCKYQYRQVTPAMKWDWRVTTVIKRLRKLHKMTTQIHGTIWLWTQASHVQLQSRQGMVFQRSLSRAVQVPPARNSTLLYPCSVAKLKKNTSATFAPYRFLVFLCTKNIPPC